MSIIIRLQNLPWSANAMDIRRFFYGLQIPDGGVHIVGGDKGDAFIAFSSDEDARKAMMLDRSRILNESVNLLLSSKSEMQTVISLARNASDSDTAKTGSQTVQGQPKTPYSRTSYPPKAQGDPGSYGHSPDLFRKAAEQPYQPSYSSNISQPQVRNLGQEGNPARRYGSQDRARQGQQYEQYPTKQDQPNIHANVPDISNVNFNRPPPPFKAPDRTVDSNFMTSPSTVGQIRGAFSQPPPRVPYPGQENPMKNTGPRFSTPNQNTPAPLTHPVTATRGHSGDKQAPSLGEFPTKPSSGSSLLGASPYEKTSSIHRHPAESQSPMYKDVSDPASRQRYVGNEQETSPHQFSRNTGEMRRPSQPGNHDFPESQAGKRGIIDRRNEQTYHGPGPKPGATDYETRPLWQQRNEPAGGEKMQFEGMGHIKQDTFNKGMNQQVPSRGDGKVSRWSDSGEVKNPGLIGDSPGASWQQGRSQGSGAGQNAHGKDWRSSERNDRDRGDIDSNRMPSGMRRSETTEQGRDDTGRGFPGTRREPWDVRAYPDDESVLTGTKRGPPDDRRMSSGNLKAYPDVSVPRETGANFGSMLSSRTNRPDDRNMPYENVRGPDDDRIPPGNMRGPDGGRMPPGSVRSLEGGRIPPDNMRDQEDGRMLPGNMRGLDSGRIHPGNMRGPGDGRMPPGLARGSDDGRFPPGNVRDHGSRMQLGDTRTTDDGKVLQPGLMKGPDLGRMPPEIRAPNDKRMSSGNTMGPADGNIRGSEDKRMFPGNTDSSYGERMPPGYRGLDDGRNPPENRGRNDGRMPPGNKGPDEMRTLQEQRGAGDGRMPPGNRALSDRRTPLGNRGPDDGRMLPEHSGPGDGRMWQEHRGPGDGRMLPGTMRGPDGRMPLEHRGPDDTRIPPGNMYGPDGGRKPLGNVRGPDGRIPGEELKVQPGMFRGPVDGRIPPDNMRRSHDGPGPLETLPSDRRWQAEDTPWNRRSNNDDGRLVTETSDPQNKWQNRGNQQVLPLENPEVFSRFPNTSIDDRIADEKQPQGLLPTPKKKALLPSPMDQERNSEQRTQSSNFPYEQNQDFADDRRQVVLRDESHRGGTSESQLVRVPHNENRQQIGKPALLDTPGNISKPTSLLGEFRGNQENQEGLYRNVGGESCDFSDNSCCLVRNLPRDVHYKDVRRFFSGCMMPNKGLKLINDDNGNRNGEGYIIFVTEDAAARALERNGQFLAGHMISVIPVSKERYDIAIDSFHPQKSAEMMGTTPDDLASAAMLLQRQQVLGCNTLSNTAMGSLGQPVQRNLAQYQQAENMPSTIVDRFRANEINIGRGSPGRSQIEHGSDFINERHSSQERQQDNRAGHPHERRGSVRSQDRQTNSKERTRSPGRRSRNRSLSKSSPRQARSRSPTQRASRCKSTPYVLVSKLPRNVTRQDIRDLFRGLRIARKGDAVHLEMNASGTLTGSALVEMETEKDNDEAVKNRFGRIGSNEVKIYRMSKREYTDRIEVSREHDKKLRSDKCKGKKDDKEKTTEKNGVKKENESKPESGKSGEDSLSSSEKQENWASPLKRKLSESESNQGVPKKVVVENASVQETGRQPALVQEVSPFKDPEGGNNDPKLSWAEEVAMEEEKTAVNEVESNIDCVVVEGLPANCTELKLTNFFSYSQIQTNGIHLIKTSAYSVHTTGFVEFVSAQECKKAQWKNKALIDLGVISVRGIRKADMLKMKAEALNECILKMEATSSPGQKQPLLKSPALPKTMKPLLSDPVSTPVAQSAEGHMAARPHVSNAPAVCSIKATNLPFHARVHEIASIFRDFNPKADEILKRHDPVTGRPTGEALIPFFNREDMNNAWSTLHKSQQLGRRLYLAIL